jgi:hypothetical protein
MLSNIGYTLVLGFPLVLWLGALTGISFISTASVMALNMYAGMKIPFVWHHRLAALSLALMMAHAALAIAAYI